MLSSHPEGMRIKVHPTQFPCPHSITALMERTMTACVQGGGNLRRRLESSDATALSVRTSGSLKGKGNIFWTKGSGYTTARSVIAWLGSSRPMILPRQEEAEAGSNCKTRDPTGAPLTQAGILRVLEQIRWLQVTNKRLQAGEWFTDIPLGTEGSRL